MGEGTSSAIHFLITQLLNLPWVIIVWFICFFGVLPEHLKNAMEESFYFIPLFLFLTLLLYLFIWRPFSDLTIQLALLSVLGFICGVVFIGIFCGCFIKPLNYTFIKGENCQIQRTNMAYFGQSEKYAAMNILFYNEDNELVNGQGCASSKKDKGLVGEPFTYKYYERDEIIGCGQEKGIKDILQSTLESSFYADPNEVAASNRFLYDNPIQNKTSYSDNIYEKVGGYRSSYSSYRSSYRSYSSYYRSYGRTYKNRNQCTYSQNFTDVKLPAWHCKDWDDYESDLLGQSEIVTYKDCYYTVFGDKDKAKKNGYNMNLKAENMTDFYLVTFDKDPKYDRTALLLIIGFCLVPFVLFTHQIWLIYQADKIYYRFCAKRNKINIQNNNSKLEENNEAQKNNDFVQHNNGEQEVKNYNNNQQQNRKVIVEQPIMDLYNWDNNNVENQQHQITPSGYQQDINQPPPL